MIKHRFVNDFRNILYPAMFRKTVSYGMFSASIHVRSGFLRTWPARLMTETEPREAQPTHIKKTGRVYILCKVHLTGDFILLKVCFRYMFKLFTHIRVVY